MSGRGRGRGLWQAFRLSPLTGRRPLPLSCLPRPSATCTPSVKRAPGPAAMVCLCREGRNTGWLGGGSAKVDPCHNRYDVDGRTLTPPIRGTVSRVIRWVVVSGVSHREPTHPQAFHRWGRHSAWNFAGSKVMGNVLMMPFNPDVDPDTSPDG